MGFKRPYDDEEVQELPFKHQRQLEFWNKQTSFAEDVFCNDACLKDNISGEDEGNSGNSQYSDEFAVSIKADKDVDSSTPLSWVTSSGSEEDRASGAEAYSSLSLDYFDFNFPRRKFVQFENVYSSFLDHSPRKQVPVGPSYQANIPEWGLPKFKNKLLGLETSTFEESSSRLMGLDHVFETDEEKLMGTCVIPMPDSELSAQDHEEVGDGRKNCDCLDGGSVRCVRLHIMEARERLRKTLGPEKFVDLGFCEMGEEVTHNWSEEEEQIFHEVVFSNPASLGKNFWELLSMELPSRTRSEVVSYYFNVFILRRRAAQNRSYFLDIDSDDDEWHGRNGDSFNVGIIKKDEIGSLVGEDDQADDEEDSSEDDDNGNDDDACDNDDDGEADLWNGGGNTNKEDGGRNNMSEAIKVKSHKECKFVSSVHHADMILGACGEDDSCTSFECQPNMDNQVETGAVMQEDGVRSNHSKCWPVDSIRSGHGTGPGYFSDPGDTEVFDGTYLKGVNPLPTWNMIEEFFEPGCWDDESKEDKGSN